MRMPKGGISGEAFGSILRGTEAARRLSRLSGGGWRLRGVAGLDAASRSNWTYVAKTANTDRMHT